MGGNAQRPKNRGPDQRAPVIKRVGRRAESLADPHSNASFAAEVQSNSEAAARLSGLRQSRTVQARPLGGTNRVADARGLDFCAARNTREFWQFALN
jgi:hypothetical protein